MLTFQEIEFHKFISTKLIKALMSAKIAEVILPTKLVRISVIRTEMDQLI